MEENTITDEYQKLICSEDFNNALIEGSDVRSEISGTIKERNKNNYDYFYDIMLRSRRDIQEICDKKKKNRTPEENDALKKFIKQTKKQYRFTKDMIFVSEDESLNDDGTKNTVPKKLSQIVEKLTAVCSLLKYIGNTLLEDELNKNGITLTAKRLEDVSEVFENEQIKSTVVSVFTDACNIQKDIDSAEKKIKEDIFINSVPQKLQFDKDSNPSGIKDTDFKKLVNLKYKMVKSENADSEAQEKANENVISEAEKRTFDIERNKVIRAGLLAIGVDEDSEEMNQFNEV